MVIKHFLAPKFHARKTLAEKRQVVENFAKWAVLPSDARVEKIQIGGIYAEWVSVKDVFEDKIILYLHGGGYNICSPNTHRELCAHISRAGSARVLLLDYRLAPENPFPAALDDAVSAYRWLLENGYSSKNIAIAGDSAGGGLSIAASIALRDQGDPAPSSIACMSPWTDLGMSGASIKTHAGIDPVVTLEALQLMASNYIKGNGPRTPLISPVFADLKGLSPLLCHAGSAEMLLDDSLRVVEKAKNQGVDATLNIYDRMWHVWHLSARLMPEAQKAVKEFGSFIRSHFAG
jgi:acetyl esterase/lipase